MKMLGIVSQVSKATGMLLLVAGGVAQAQEDVGIQNIGKMEFQKHCAVCHGMSGKGDGPIVEFLKQMPPDLTLLSKKHGGVYPQAKVYEWIRDADRIRAHGTQDMPIWGERYSQQIIEQYGEHYSGPRSSVQERILELVFYIGAIQQ